MPCPSEVDHSRIPPNPLPPLRPPPEKKSMSGKILSCEERDAVAVLTLQRPEKRNALSAALRRGLVEALVRIQGNPTLRAVVLTGAGPAFCAGFDRSEFSESGMEEVFAEAESYHESVYNFGKPLIAAVNGPALGGGCDLAALCDLRIASAAATFGQPQVRFGAPALYPLMRELVGTGPAREMCLSGRIYPADEALEMGLVNRVVASEELLEAALEVAVGIAGLPEGLAEDTKRGFVATQPTLFGS